MTQLGENHGKNGTKRYDEIDPQSRVEVDHAIAVAYRDRAFPWRHEPTMRLLYVRHRFSASEIRDRFCALAHARGEPDRTVADSTVSKWIRKHHGFEVRPGRYYHLPEDERDEWLERYRNGEAEQTTTNGNEKEPCKLGCGAEVASMARHIPSCPKRTEAASTDTAGKDEPVPGSRKWSEVEA